MTVEDCLNLLREKADDHHKQGLLRYGIPNENALGVRMPDIRKIGKRLGKNQVLAEALWNHPIHEAKHLGISVANPKTISQETLERWVPEIYSWDLCDHLSDVTARTLYRMRLVEKWVRSDHEFIKRSAIVTLISIVLHDKKLPDNEIEKYLKLIEREAWDDRNFVKKAVNWLLRQIGKKNLYLNGQAVECGNRLLNHPDKSARWIAKDALKELTSVAVRERLIKKEKS